MTEDDRRGIIARLFPDRGSGPVRRHRGDFRFNTLSAIVLLTLFGAGAALQATIGPTPAGEDLAFAAAGVLAAAAVLFTLPYWAFVVLAVGAVWGTLPTLLSVDLSLLAVGVSLGLLIAPGVEVISHWDKIVVLRLGKFHRVRGPGPLLLLPLLDSIAGYIDTRIRVTDFSAEKSLTKDTVPVHVDALAFWMIWDPHRAVLEVQDFEQSVILSAQTALRASIGANDLATLLSERDRMGSEIQQIVDAKTNPWGITILSVEFKEILIPAELEDALSKQAQASREQRARVILGGAEAEIASSYVRAADHYRDDPIALQLRAMSMIYESVRTKGGLVLVPSDALKGMNLGTVLGARAYQGQHGGVDEPDPGSAASGDATG
ncbi:MAG: slipin family protein [Spirochaetota bacterium]